MLYFQYVMSNKRGLTQNPNLTQRVPVRLPYDPQANQARPDAHSVKAILYRDTDDFQTVELTDSQRMQDKLEVDGKLYRPYTGTAWNLPDKAGPDTLVYVLDDMPEDHDVIRVGDP